MRENERLVPKRRFKEFQDAGDWEQRKVKDMFTVTRGQVLAVTETSNKRTGEFPFPVYSSQTKNNGLMGYYSKYLFEDAITWTTDGANAGTVNYRQGKFYSTNVNGVLLSKDGYANQAVSESLNKVAWRHVSKVGNPKLMNNVMSEITIFVPKIEEQQKLSTFFEQINDTIALHQRKLQKLKALKTSYLYEMFPSKGKKRPRRRFAGFHDDWEQYELIEIADLLNNLRIPVTASDREKGNTPYYGANGIQDYVSGFTHEGEFVLIAEDGANDLINYPVNYVTGRIWVNNHAHVIKGKGGQLDNLFLASRIKSMNISSWLVGGGRAKLNGEVLKKIPVLIPSFSEQVKIGQFFKQFDDTIALQQNELEKLKSIKAAYLNEMFV